MKVCVFGAGAIGGHLAGRLAEGGAETSIVARGAHLAAVRENGLTVRAPDRTIKARVKASDDPRELGPQDAVLVTVKAPSLPSVAAGIRPLLRPETQVVFVMNGVPWWYFDHHGGPHDGKPLPRIDPGNAVRHAVGPARALGGVVYSACTVVEPGVVEVETPGSRLMIAEPNNAAPTARAEAIAAPLRAGGLTVPTTNRIRDEIWAKLLLNLASGPLGVLAQSPAGAIFTQEACIAAARRVFAEGLAVAEAMGCYPQHDAGKTVTQFGRSQHKASIVQDLELGRPMEVDALFVQPLEFARMSGVATPTLDLLVTLVKLRAEAAGLYRP